MCLILRWMPDAFQPRMLVALLAALFAVGAGVGFVLGSQQGAEKPATTVRVAVPRTSPAAAPAPCQLNLAALSVTGCKPLKSDTGAARDPTGLWGSVDCANDSRQRWIAPGYRRLTVIDGDNVFGERCELGRNGYSPGSGPPTFALYREGEHRITFLSIRLPAWYPLSNPAWQVVMQMKQTDPADNANGTPVLALHAEANQWRLFHASSVDRSFETVQLWNAPAAPERWTRFAFDVVYSQNPSAGRVKVYADLNGDGDATDPGEQSPMLSTYTLKRESAPTTSPDDDPVAEGQAIPSHLRVGVYHNPAIACPAPRGCAIDVDDVAVYAAP
jgi:hypothetical protein